MPARTDDAPCRPESSAYKQKTVRDEGHHAAFVDEFLARTAGGLPAEAQLRLFEAALDALWLRTSTTLGEVTLFAVTDRVLHNAAKAFPFLATLKVASNGGIELGELKERAASLRAAELLAGIRLVLVEFLTVIGNLTAEVLTDELHRELSRIASRRGRKNAKTKRADEDEGS